MLQVKNKRLCYNWRFKVGKCRMESAQLVSFQISSREENRGEYKQAGQQCRQCGITFLISWSACHISRRATTSTEGITHRRNDYWGLKKNSNRYLRDLPIPFGPTCWLTSSIVCWMLGSTSRGQPQLDEDLQLLYQVADSSFAEVTVKTMHAKIEDKIQLRYRYS